MAVAAMLYWLVGVAGYVTFRSRTAGDILRNFGAAHVGVSGSRPLFRFLFTQGWP